MSLYKYLKPQRVDVLNRLMIRFTPPIAFNDPFELKPSHEVSKDRAILEEEAKSELLRKYEELPSSTKTQLDFESFCQQCPSFLEKFCKNITDSSVVKKFEEEIERQIKRFGILSLTEIKDSLLMWAHYADSHQGFVMEFDDQNEFFKRNANPNAQTGHLIKMSYAHDRPKVVLPGKPGLSALYCKSKEWEYEGEWRIILSLKEATKVIPAEEGDIHLFELPPKTIKSVICGCRMSKCFKSCVRKALKKDYMSHVKLFEAEIDSAQYKLRMKPVNIINI